MSDESKLVLWVASSVVGAIVLWVLSDLIGTWIESHEKRKRDKLTAHRELISNLGSVTMDRDRLSKEKAELTDSYIRLKETKAKQIADLEGMLSAVQRERDNLEESNTNLQAINLNLVGHVDAAKAALVVKDKDIISLKDDLHKADNQVVQAELRATQAALSFQEEVTKNAEAVEQLRCQLRTAKACADHHLEERFEFAEAFYKVYTTYVQPIEHDIERNISERHKKERELEKQFLETQK